MVVKVFRWFSGLLFPRRGYERPRVGGRSGGPGGACGGFGGGSGSLFKGFVREVRWPVDLLFPGCLKTYVGKGLRLS